MAADGSTRAGPGCVCFHFTNKIYNPLTLLTPTPTLAVWLVGGGWFNWKSMHQFYSNKEENMRGQKSTNLPKLAKCLEWEQGRGETADCSQRWAGPDDRRCIPVPERGSDTERPKQRRIKTRGTRWLSVSVRALFTNEMKRAFKLSLMSWHQTWMKSSAKWWPL